MLWYHSSQEQSISLAAPEFYLGSIMTATYVCALPTNEQRLLLHGAADISKGTVPYVTSIGAPSSGGGMRHNIQGANGAPREQCRAP